MLRGEGRLAIERVDGASALVAASPRAAPNLRAAPPRPERVGRDCDHGGGLVEGDESTSILRSGAGAAALLSTQAETKVYRSPGWPLGLGSASRHGWQAACWRLPPSRSRPSPGRATQQQQRFELAPTASLLLVDALVAGRTARGERWAFDRYRSQNEVRVGGRLVAGRCAPARTARAGGAAPGGSARFQAFALLVAIGPRVRGLRRRAGCAVEALPCAAGAPLLATVSPVPGGVLRALRGHDHRGARRVRPGGHRSGRRRARRRRVRATLVNGGHMHLTPRELDKLLLHQAGLPRPEAARARTAAQPPRGRRRSSRPRSWSSSATGARVAELMDVGRRMLGRRQVMPGVPELLERCRWRAPSPTGPSSSPSTTRSRASTATSRSRCYGSFLPVPPRSPLRRRRAGSRRPRPARCSRRRGRSSSTPAARRWRSRSTNLGDRPDPGREATTTSPRRTRPRASTARRAYGTGSTSRPAWRCASSPARRAPCSSSPSPARRWSAAATGSPRAR